MSYAKEDAQKMLNMIENSDAKFSEWEIGFIDSIMNWIGRGDDLTEKQSAILDILFEKACSNYSTEGIPGDMMK